MKSEKGLKHGRILIFKVKREKDEPAEITTRPHTGRKKGKNSYVQPGKGSKK